MSTLTQFNLRVTIFRFFYNKIQIKKFASLFMVSGGVSLRRSIGAMVDGSSLYPSAETTLPRNTTSLLNIAHFFGFNLTPYFFNC